LRVYLIRHGVTEYNRKGIVQGYREVPINDLGIQQAARLAQRMADMPLDHIYTSDLRRATMTAAIIAAYTGAPIGYDVGFRERNPGDLSGKPQTESEGFFTDPAYDPPNGEGVPVFHERVRNAFSGLVKREHGSGRHIAVVSHGMVCTAFLRAVVGQSEEEVASTSWPNTALTIVDYNGQWNIHTLGDATHLDGLDTHEGHATGA
jgi:broad specificity phosphatase PhoE